MKKKEELSDAFKELTEKTIKLHNGDKIEAYAQLIDELLNKYMLIPVGLEIGKVIKNNIDWLIEAVREEMQNKMVADLATEPND